MDVWRPEGLRKGSCLGGRKISRRRKRERGGGWCGAAELKGGKDGDRFLARVSKDETRKARDEREEKEAGSGMRGWQRIRRIRRSMKNERERGEKS